MTVSAQESRPLERSSWWQLEVLWASLAISVIWLAVLVDGVWGPDIVSQNAAGSGATVPSVVVVAPCAVVATWLIARHAFRYDHS